MELVIVILILVFVFANANGKSKKQAAAKGQTQPTQAGRQARQRQRPRNRFDGPELKVNYSEAVEMLREQMAEAAIPRETAEPVAEPVVNMAEGARQGASMLADDECAGGSMAHTHDEGHSRLDDEDCAGGSMAHTHTEGVSRAAHARRMAAIDAYSVGDVLPETIDARALRRAVVMAEVLGKPRALRKT